MVEVCLLRFMKFVGGYEKGGGRGGTKGTKANFWGRGHEVNGRKRGNTDELTSGSPPQGVGGELLKTASWKRTQGRGESRKRCYV